MSERCKVLPQGTIQLEAYLSKDLKDMPHKSHLLNNKASKKHNMLFLAALQET